MKAAVLTAPGAIEIRECETPEPGPAQVLLRLQGCGVCSSNIPPFEGREWFNYPLPPGNPGHEAWGIVEAVGRDVRGLQPGDRVAALSERAYATHDIAAADQVVRLPSALDGQPFPGEPFSCAFNIFRRSRIRPGNRVAIIGIGFMGAVLVALAKQAGAEVIAISRRDSSLALAERMGAQHCIRMDDHWRIIDAVKGLTGGAGCEVVIEAVGAQWPLDLAGELTAERGTLVIAGYHQDSPRQVNMQLWNWRGLDVINAHERDPQVYVQGMKDAVEAIVAGHLDPKPLLTHSFPLHELDKALEMTKSRPEGFVKALIRVD